MPQIQRRLHEETLELQGTKKYKETGWQHVWHPTLNQGLQLSQMPAHSMQKVYLTKICGIHIAYQSMKSAVISPDKSWFNCKICAKWYNRSSDKKIPQASKTERIALNIVNDRYAPDQYFLDCRIVLDGTKVGSIDVWMPQHNLAIMLDGASHFVHKYNVTKSTQRKIDDRFCVCALKQVNVLRVHYHDVGQIAAHIRNALLKQTTSATSAHVLSYSPTFFRLKFVDEQHIADMLAKSAAQTVTVEEAV